MERAFEEASLSRTPADPDLFQRYNSLVGSERHCVKYRPDISAAMDLLGCCLTFPTERLYRCAVHFGALWCGCRRRPLTIEYPP